MNHPTITITPIHVADLDADGRVMPVNVFLINHPEGGILVDTGLTRTHPLVEDMNPRIDQEGYLRIDSSTIDFVVNTHLHFDHCGGNHLFPGVPIYVQKTELEDATAGPDYTIPEWVHAPGVSYVPVDGEIELVRDVRLLPAPGHTRGSQIVVVESAGGSVAIVGDLAVTFEDLDHPQSPGQRLVRELQPRCAWLAHQSDPWSPSADSAIAPSSR